MRTGSETKNSIDTTWSGGVLTITGNWQDVVREECQAFRWRGGLL